MPDDFVVLEKPGMPDNERNVREIADHARNQLRMPKLGLHAVRLPFQVIPEFTRVDQYRKFMLRKTLQSRLYRLVADRDLLYDRMQLEAQRAHSDMRFKMGADIFRLRKIDAGKGQYPVILPSRRSRSSNVT